MKQYRHIFATSTLTLLLTGHLHECITMKVKGPFILKEQQIDACRAHVWHKQKVILHESSEKEGQAKNKKIL